MGFRAGRYSLFFRAYVASVSSIAGVPEPNAAGRECYMSIRMPSCRERSSRRAARWPLMGACLWLFLMTLLGAEVASGERTGPGAFPDEGQHRDTSTGQAGRGGDDTDL